MKPRTPKWMLGLTRDMPVGEAARRVLSVRLNDVAKLLPRAVKSDTSERGVKAVHELRVACRRATSALEAFSELLDEDLLRKTRRRLRHIRRAAGAVRDCDVHVQILADAVTREDSAATRGAVKQVVREFRGRRTQALPDLAAVAERWPAAKLRKRTTKLLEPLDQLGDETTLGELADRVIRREIDAVKDAAASDLTDLENVHELRVRLKHLRYAAEVVTRCFGQTWERSLLPRLIEMQGLLGEINDTHLLLGVLSSRSSEGKQGGSRGKKAVDHKNNGSATRRAKSDQDAKNFSNESGLKIIAVRQKERLDLAHAAFVSRWNEFVSSAFFDELVAAMDPIASVSVQTTPEPLSSARVLKPMGFIEPKGATAEPRRRTRRRIAAIDVGTNSVRLIVAEDQPDGSYRVLDDEKERTRLGQGLQKTGKMSTEAMEHTAVTVARMRSIADGYQAEEIRVVGTAAAREAGNAAALARLIEQRSGLTMQVISGEEEAMLAYRSAASAFELRDVSSAVVDIGGGSTEIVLSAAVMDQGDDARRAGLGGGVIERVYTVPIGAVVLTERFGGPESSGGKQFDALREHVTQMLREKIGKPPIVPQVVIGTGGTITTLAAMVKLRSLGSAGDGLFGSVQGFEIDRADVKHLLAQLRGMPVKDRVKVPGLAADRADIIIAGLVTVDAVMKRLGVNRMRVHEGGIRDGILLGMVRGTEDAADPKRDPMKGVRRFAKACGYEAAHSKHVTALAMEIFDQLGAQQEMLTLEPGMSFDGEARLLLEAAALLHDIGYLINYAQHHKHSYHLIVHADLPGFTSRQVHVIANVARYHRAAEPKAKHRTLANLKPEDHALVRGLSAVLRIADGLDRTHTQCVQHANVKLAKDAAHIGVSAETEPSVDMWGAVRKSRLFQRVFGVTTHYEWRGAGEAVESESGVRRGTKVVNRVRQVAAV